MIVRTRKRIRIQSQIAATTYKLHKTSWDHQVQNRDDLAFWWLRAQHDMFYQLSVLWQGRKTVLIIIECWKVTRRLGVSGEDKNYANWISLMKQKFLLTYKIPQTEIIALLDTWVTNTLSARKLCPQQNCFSLCFRHNITWLFVSQLRIRQAFSVSCNNEFWWVTTNCDMTKENK